MTVKSKPTERNGREAAVVGYGPQLLAALIRSTAVGCFGFALAFVVGIVAILIGVLRAERAAAPPEG